MSFRLSALLIFGYFILIRSQTCDPSITHCLGCTEISLFCDQCESGYYNIGGDCINVCPNLSVGMVIDGEGICLCDGNTWIDEQTDLCVACHPSCKTCYGPSDTECGLDRN